MDSERMTNQHQSTAPWEWRLGAGAATRLAAAATPRWLLVTAGRAWLTQSGAGPDGADVWLAAGERHRLPAGTEWVVEGWPEARLELLEAPAPRLGAAPSLRRWRAWAPLLRAA